MWNGNHPIADSTSHVLPPSFGSPASFGSLITHHRTIWAVAPRRPGAHAVMLAPSTVSLYCLRTRMYCGVLRLDTWHDTSWINVSRENCTSTEGKLSPTPLDAGVHVGHLDTFHLPGYAVGPSS